MIKINKYFAKLPPSLYISQKNFDDPIDKKNSPRVSWTTQIARKQIIEKGTYIKKNKYDLRYKYPDIKDTLLKIYHHKCAYCESRDRTLHVEHYRPKKDYWWLAFSWDNLLLACAFCNTKKGSKFELQNGEVDRIKSLDKIDFIDINGLSQKYNKIEKPKFINPEIDDIEDKIIFDKDGTIKAMNNSIDSERINHTIGICDLNEEELKGCRQSILAKLKRNIKAFIVIFPNDLINQEKIMNKFFESFLYEAFDDSESYLAFRRYAIEHFLNDIKNELLINI